MQPFPSLSRLSFLAAALGLLAAGGMLGACDRHSAADLFAPLDREARIYAAVGSLLGACDRHSAEELPESYGHGSAHKRAFDRHQPDSRQHSDHFSDSQGIASRGGDEARDEPTATPTQTESGKMFPH